MIVIVPFPSVWILVQATTDFPESPAPEWDADRSSSPEACRWGGLGDGIIILRLISLSVSSPCAPLGFTRANGYTTGEDAFPLNLMRGLGLQPAGFNTSKSQTRILQAISCTFQKSIHEGDRRVHVIEFKTILDKEVASTRRRPLGEGCKRTL